jgi:hypothetical protein
VHAAGVFLRRRRSRQRKHRPAHQPAPAGLTSGLPRVGLSAGHIIVQGIRLAIGVRSLIRDVEAVLRIQRTNEKTFRTLEWSADVHGSRR